MINIGTDTPLYDRYNNANILDKISTWLFVGTCLILGSRSISYTVSIFLTSLGINHHYYGSDFKTSLLFVLVPTCVFNLMSLYIFIKTLCINNTSPKYRFRDAYSTPNYFDIDYDSNGDRKVIIALLLSIRISLFFFVFWAMVQYEYYDRNDLITLLLNIGIPSLVLYFFAFSDHNRAKLSFKTFPFEYLRIDSNQLNLLTQYSDYDKINFGDDRSGLKVGQKFIVKTRDFPTNKYLEQEVLILNQISAKKTALVTIIEHSGLANEIRKGEKLLVAELVAIGEHTQLEIALRLEPKGLK